MPNEIWLYFSNNEIFIAVATLKVEEAKQLALHTLYIIFHSLKICYNKQIFFKKEVLSLYSQIKKKESFCRFTKIKTKRNEKKLFEIIWIALIYWVYKVSSFEDRENNIFILLLLVASSVWFSWLSWYIFLFLFENPLLKRILPSYESVLT